MELGLIQSLFGFVGENFLGQGAYDLAKPVLGKFAFAPIPLAKAAYRGVSQLFNEKSGNEKAKDEALVGFFDGLGEALNLAFGATPLGCALGVGMGSFFSEGARAYTQNHNLSEALGMGAKAVLCGLALGLPAAVLHWRTKRPLADELVSPPSVLTREVQKALPGLKERLARHKAQFLARGGSEELFQRFFERVGFVGKGRFDRAILEMANDMRGQVGHSYYLGNNFEMKSGGVKPRSGLWIATRLQRKFGKDHLISSYELLSRPYSLSRATEVIIVDDAIYSGGQARYLIENMIQNGCDPSKIRIATVGITRDGLDMLDELGITTAWSRYEISQPAGFLDEFDLRELQRVYGFRGDEKLTVFRCGYLTALGHRFTDNMVPPLVVEPSVFNFSRFPGMKFGIFDPTEHRYPKSVDDLVRRSRV